MFITAEQKKGKYVYYSCTGFHGLCGNDYIREERLADLLGGVVERIQIPAEVADSIAVGIRSEQKSLDRGRKQSRDFSIDPDL